ncbi:MAG TPA: trypsin-like serine protease [Devosia sp.]|nr:trypsin-like serine protease [Devosia sp.]
MRVHIAVSSIVLCLLALPAFAQDAVEPTTGAEQTRPTSAAADIPYAEPMPLLEVADDPEAARSIGGPDPSIFGTTRYYADGRVETFTPSDELLAEIHDTRAEISDLPEAIDRNIIGADSRVRIEDATRYPFRAVGYIFAEWASGKRSACSGTLIGKSTVLTAGHCLWAPDWGGRPVLVDFYPGANAPNKMPYGVYHYASFDVFSGFIETYNQAYYNNTAMQTDMAIITLSAPAGGANGTFGYRIDMDDDFDAHILGYPGDKPSMTLWRADCTIPLSRKFPNYLMHECDAWPGMSGAGVYWVDPEGRRYLRGIFVGVSVSVNYALRINPLYMQWIKERTY